MDLLVTVVPGTALGFERYGLPVLVEELTGRKADMLFDSQLVPKPWERSSRAMVRESILEDVVPL